MKPSILIPRPLSRWLATAGLVLAAVASPGQAADRTLSCPDPATVTRVGACPTEEELRYTFTGFCSSNERLYGRDAEVCSSFEQYRQVKDVVLVESADGEFQGYLSCRLDPKALQGLKPSGVAATRRGSLTRVVCSYPDGVTLVHRTKSSCTVADAARCAGDPQACQARCD